MKTETALLQAALPVKSLRRQMLDGVFWLTAVKIFGQVISWTITIYVMRILSPNDYGLMAMAGVYLSFIMLFGEVGLGTALIQQKYLAREDISSICWAILLLNVGLCLFSVLLAPVIAGFFNESRLTDVIRVASISFVFNGLGSVSYNMLTRDMIFNRRSQAEMISRLCGSLSTLWLAMQGFGVWSLVWGNISIEIVKNLLLFFFYPWKPEFAFSFSKVKGMLDFGSKVLLARLFWHFTSNVDFLIAGKLLGKTQLGYYAIAFQLASIPLDKIVSTISQVAFPTFSKVQGDHVLLRRYFLKIVKFLAFIIFPAFWIIFLIAGRAVPLFLSENWLPAVLPLQIICMVSAFRAIESMNAPLVMAIGRPGITMINNLIIGAGLTVSFLVGSSYGLEGLAYAWLVFPIFFLITTWISLNLIGLSLVEYIKELRHPFLGTLLTVITVLIIQEMFLDNLGLLAHVAASAISGIVFYFLYYFLFHREIFAEAKELLKR